MRSILFAALFLILPFFSSAQISSDGAIQTGLSLEINPTHPSPDEAFTLTLNDYGGGGYGAQINWYQNDTLLEWATGQRSITRQAPAAGQSATVRAVLVKPDGARETVSHTVTPLYLDIIIEPQTHVPSFFKGRALPSPGSTVNATALLSSGTIRNPEYLYTWRLNSTTLQGGPLRGGNTISFTMPQDSYSTLTLTVTTFSGTIIAKRSIAIPVAAPKLLFYEVSTLYGTLERALTSPYTLSSNSMTLRAEPYYLDSDTFNNPSVASWQLNGTAVQNSGNPYSLILEQTGVSGLVDVTFRVQSTTKLLQGAKGSLNISTL